MKITWSLVRVISVVTARAILVGINVKLEISWSGSTPISRGKSWFRAPEIWQLPDCELDFRCKILLALWSQCCTVIPSTSRAEFNSTFRGGWVQICEAESEVVYPLNLGTSLYLLGRICWQELDKLQETLWGRGFLMSEKEKGGRTDILISLTALKPESSIQLGDWLADFEAVLSLQ